MTRVKLLTDDGGLCGFHISGHSSESCEDEIGKIVCAAVSSAAYMAANTLEEILHEQCTAHINEAEMKFTVRGASDTARAVLAGFGLHMEQLSSQYGNKIKIHGGADHVKA